MIYYNLNEFLKDHSTHLHYSSNYYATQKTSKQFIKN